MTKEFQTPHVFIDTEVFISLNFQFHSGRLKRLSELGQKGIIKIYLTDITKREVESNIKKRVKESIKLIQNFKGDTRIVNILRNFPEFKFMFDCKGEQITTFTEDLMQNFENFLIITNANIISSKNVSIESVFNKYFSQKPPFGKREDKKSEFPDAFSIAAIEKWCQDNDKSIYVISNDNDIKSSCSENNYLLSLSKLDELFELVTLENLEGNIDNNEIISKLSIEFFNQLELDIKEKIIEEFENVTLSIADCYEGEVSNINVESVDLLDNYLLDIIDEFLYFQVTTEIHFSAEVHYPDPDRTYYDREDGQYIYIEYIDDTVRESLEVPAQVQIRFNKKEPHYPRVISVNLETNDDIYISVDEDYGYPYK